MLSSSDAEMGSDTEMGPPVGQFWVNAVSPL